MTSTSSPAEGVGGHGVAGDSIVLEEEIDQNYVPSEDEVREYAKWLGMELGDDLDLFWIAKEGLKAPLPENWKPCKTVDTEEIYYFNFATGESTWDHPCDEYYRKLYEEEKKKKLTKDKARHDKSKQQARKDVSQLLGKEKRKKKPSGKRPVHQSSPECVQTVLSSASSIFDRKPLPDIGRQPLQGGHNSVHQVASTAQSDKAVDPGDTSPLRTHASSLVGHRLSQHLSVSVGSEKGDQRAWGDSTKPSPCSDPVRSREDASIHVSNTSTVGLESEHDNVLKKLREKHARDLDALEQAHSDTKHQLEVDHRRSVATQSRQWAESAESEVKKARHELERELQGMRTNHSREIEKLRCNLADAKARSAAAIAETETANEAAQAEKASLKSALADLERRVTKERRGLQEAHEAAEKVQATNGCQAGAELQRQLAVVLAELEDERKHVTELERRLKEANNGVLQSRLLSGDDSNQAEDFERQGEESVGSKATHLEENLAQIICENESLRKEVERAASHGDRQRDDGRTSAHDRATKTLDDAEVIQLREDLHDAESRLSKLQQAHNRSIQARRTCTSPDAEDAAAALAQLQETSADTAMENRRLMERVSNINKAWPRTGDATSGEAVNVSGAKLAQKLSDAQKQCEADTTKAFETEKLRADFEAAKKDLACYASEIQNFKELENVARTDLSAVQVALRDSQLKVAELNGTLLTVEHEKKVTSASAEELRLENERLKRAMEVARATREGQTFEGRTSREISGASTNELEERSAQLKAMALERACLVDEVEALKGKLVRSEGVLKSERGVFDSSLADQQRQVETLRTMEKKLEGELLVGQREKEALCATTKDLRESLAASKLEAWRLQVRYIRIRGNATLVLSKPLKSFKEIIRSNGQNNDSGIEMVPAIDYDKAMAEAREIALRLKEAEEEVECLKGSVAETAAKLVDSKRLVASFKDELAEARESEKETAQRLEKALSRCSKGEGSLAQARDDQAFFDASLKDAEDALEATPNGLSSRGRTPPLSKGFRDAANQTAVTVKQFCDLERTLLRSQEESELARMSFATSTQQLEDLQQRLAALQQQLANATANAEIATQQARHNSDLASTRQEELVNMSEREQATQRDLLEARSSLEDSEKAQRTATDQARRHLADRESAWRHEADGLRVALKEALATAKIVNEGEAQSSKQREVPIQSFQASEERIASPGIDEVRNPDNPTVANEAPRISTSDTSDATSRDSAEELMRKLRDEAHQGGHTRSGACHEARLWTKKLNEERRKLALAKETVRHHKERVKKRQQRLLLYQTRWRNLRHQYGSSPQEETRPRQCARHRSLDEAKRELDIEVYKLNRFVKELRSSKCWLDQRERKISDFEALLRGEGDASDLDSRPESQVSRSSSSGAQNSTPDSNGSIVKHRSLQAMEEELDKHYSEFAARSSIGGFRRPRAMPRGKKPVRAQRHPCKEGKENVCPGSLPMHHVEYLSGSDFPAESGFWAHLPHLSPGERARPYEGAPSRSRASHLAQNVFPRGPALNSGVQGLVKDTQSWSSDIQLQQWLSRPDLHARDDLRSGVIARERREHLTKLTVEGRQAQSAVALHVDWLNKLREEMGLLGLHNSQP
ncbi:unnamed protein product [Scytosiphon promiscuus]